MRVRLLALLAAGCAPSPSGLGPDGAAPIDRARALFEVPRAGSPPPGGFYALPFPNDIRVGDDGTIDLADHPRLNDLVGLYLDTIAAEQRGFGLSSASFFRFEGPLDPDSLPQGPAASRDGGASVYLVNIDPDSPSIGTRTPIVTRFKEEGAEAIGPDSLAVLPYPGFPLEEGTTYAVIVTSRLLGLDGAPAEPGADFATIAAPEVSIDPDLARAQAIYRPLWDWLDQPGGDARDDVVSASVFTTQQATGLLARVRRVIHRDLPVPEPRQIRYRHSENGYLWFDGRYRGPIFQRGEVPYLKPGDGGDIAIDPDTGDPVIQSLADLRFSMTVPEGNMPAAGWPIAIYAHGTGGDYHSFRDDGTAAWLASVGIACISIDQVLHGTRNEVAPPDISFFNLQNPLAARDNALQGALDDFQLTRLVRNFDVTRPSGLRIRFDPRRVFFFGHSQGSLTGVPFVAHEPNVSAAIFSGAGGLIFLSLLHKTEPVDIAGLVRLFLRDDPLDEYHPVLALLQMYMERSDPVSYARLLLEAPPDGIRKNVLVTEGLIDRYTPVPSIEALATAMRVDLVSPVKSDVIGLTLAGRDVLSPPLSGNWDGATGVLLQYEEAPDSDGHFVVFDLAAARVQSTYFLSTLADSGAATVVAP
jgi:predicted esterase